ESSGFHFACRPRSHSMIHSLTLIRRVTESRPICCCISATDFPSSQSRNDNSLVRSPVGIVDLLPESASHRPGGLVPGHFPKQIFVAAAGKKKRLQDASSRAGHPVVRSSS